MPKVSTTEATEEAVSRSSYPQVYPLAALQDIRMIAKRGTWLMDRAVLGRAVWEVQGAAQKICIGDPDGQPSEDVAIDPKQ